MAKQRFLFTSNSLSKGMLWAGLMRIIFGRGQSSLRESRSMIASFFGIKERQVFLFGAGRMSVYLLLKNLGLQKDNEVMVAGYTCVVLTNAVKFAGCKLVYVDIAPNHVNPSVEQVLDKITPKTRVLILPHNFGIPFEGISSIKKEHPDIIIIEDVAHSFASQSEDGKLCGTLGDAAFFSLEYSKPMTTGLGGIMIINNDALLNSFDTAYQALNAWKGKDVFRMIATLMTYNLSYFRNSTFIQVNAMRLLRLFKWQYGTSQKEISGEIPDNYPVKMSGAQACFLPPQLQRIKKINEQKRTIYRTYETFFSQFESIQSFGLEKDYLLVRYPLLFDASVSDDKIALIKQEAANYGYHFGVWFNDVVHPVGSFRYNYQEGECPNGEYLANRILNVPVNANYPPEQRDLEFLKTLFLKHQIH